MLGRSPAASVLGSGPALQAAPAVPLRRPQAPVRAAQGQKRRAGSSNRGGGGRRGEALRSQRGGARHCRALTGLPAATGAAGRARQPVAAQGRRRRQERRAERRLGQVCGVVTHVGAPTTSHPLRSLYGTAHGGDHTALTVGSRSAHPSVLVPHASNLGMHLRRGPVCGLWQAVCGFTPIE